MKWGKLLRRTLALFLATFALWWLGLTSGAGSSVSRFLGGWGLSGGTAALAAEVPREELSGFVGLLVGQSPHLRAGHVLLGDASIQSAPPAEASPSPAVLEPLPSPAPAAEDDTPLPEATPPENIVTQTFLPTNSSAYHSVGGVFVYNRTHQTLDMEALAAEPVTLTGTGKGPQILIVHTHATESYTQEGQDVYQESDPYRTTDDAHNMVRVGDEMAAAFAQMGLNVLHDRTLHDYPSYTGSYGRSYDTVEEYLAAYPSISVVLDVHRDALMGENGEVYKTAVDESVLPDSAQVMLVVGTNESGSNHPDWRKNLTFAMALERECNEKLPTLARPITLRTSSYNQQLLPGYLLVEVGTHGNSLQDAITAARAFAQTVAPVIAENLPED